jgi:hypothetical protein
MRNEKREMGNEKMSALLPYFPFPISRFPFLD